MGPSVVHQYVTAGSSPAGRSYMQQPSKNASQKRNNAVPFVRPTPFGGPYGPATQSGENAARPGRTSFNSDDDAASQQRSQQQQGHPLRSSFAWVPAELANEQQQDMSGSPGSSLRRPYSLPANSAVSFFRRTEGFDAPDEASGSPPMVTFTREPSLKRAASSGFSSLTRQLSTQHSGPAAHAAGTSAIRTSSFTFDTEPSATDAHKVQLQKCLEKSSEAHGASPPDEAVTLSQADKFLQEDPLLWKAYKLSKQAHQGRFRKNGQPVLTHCIAIARMLTEMRLDAPTVAAGLLHDVLDDTPVTEAQMRSAVSQEVTDLVVNVSRLSDYSQMHRDSLQEGLAPPSPTFASRLSSMLLAMSDPRSVLVKLTDRLHNMQTLAALPAHKQQRIAQETLDVFVPLANRLGVWTVKSQLEDLAFQILQSSLPQDQLPDRQPREHAELSEKVEASMRQGVIQQSLDKLQSLLREQRVGVVELSGRPKNLFSIFKKMQTKGYDVNRIHDVRALRLIVEDKAQCYKALRVVESLWPATKEYKDYIRFQKPNGYQSLHTILQLPDGAPMEVQIRSHKMHWLAEYGLAAHWRYKEQLYDEASQMEEDKSPTGMSPPTPSPFSLDGAAAASPPQSVGVAPPAKTRRTSRGSRSGGAQPAGQGSGYIDSLTAWARFVISWVLEVQDKKCHPTGSPGTPNALAAMATQICGNTFPDEHTPSCKFAAYIQKGILPPVRPSERASEQVNVLLVNKAALGEQSMPLKVAQVPSIWTQKELLQSGHLGGPTAGDVKVMVNGEPLHGTLMMLEHGDKVEVVAVPQEQPVPFSEPQMPLQAQRAALSRIFERAPSGQPAMA